MTNNTFKEHIVYREAEEQHWKVGQVAQLFGISVQTLRFYDRIGLFSPDARDELTGYRYYRQTQVYRLANIVYLRKQGYSIEEIKSYIDGLTFRGRATELQLQAKRLDDEVKRLTCLSRALQEKIRYIDENDYAKQKSSIHIADVEPRNYIEIGLENELYASNVFYYFPTVVIYHPEEKIFGACIRDKSDFLSYASLFDNFANLETHWKTIPGGKMLRCFYKGPHEVIGNQVIAMITYAKRHGIKLAGYSIHYNIIDQFVESDPNQYVTELQIPIVGE